jgi:diaminopimelate decarboxylase
MKFGIPDDQVLDVACATLSMPNIALVGVAAHIGSQVSNAEPFAVTARQLEELVADVRDAGVTTLRYLDVGGGLAVTYENEAPTDLVAFAERLRPIVQRTGLSLVLEPGRYLVAESGVLLARVIYRKHSGGKDIVITDGAMNDLIRPALYDAYHAIDAVDSFDREIVADVVGPVCESGDFLALDRRIADVQSGDLLAVRTAGAYGYAMASNYNTRPRPAEVLVDGDRFAVVNRREVFDDLVRGETVTPTWNELSCASD